MTPGRRNGYVEIVLGLATIGLFVDVPTPTIWYARATLADPNLIVALDDTAGMIGCAALFVAALVPNDAWRRRLLFAGMGLAFAGALVCGATGSFTIYGVFRIVGLVGVGLALPVALSTAIVAAKPSRLARTWMRWSLVAWFVCGLPMFAPLEDETWRATFLLSAALLLVTLGLAWRIEPSAFASRSSPIGAVFGQEVVSPVTPEPRRWRDLALASLAAVGAVALLTALRQLDVHTMISIRYAFPANVFVSSIALKVALLIAAGLVADRVSAFVLVAAGTLTGAGLLLLFLAIDAARQQQPYPDILEAATNSLGFVACAVAAVGLVTMMTDLAGRHLVVVAALMAAAYLLPQYVWLVSSIDDTKTTIAYLLAAFLIASMVRRLVGREPALAATPGA